MTDRIKYVTRRLYEYQGEQMPLGRIARLTGINTGTLYGRVVERGMSVEQALKLPHGQGLDRKEKA